MEDCGSVALGWLALHHTAWRSIHLIGIEAFRIYDLILHLNSVPGEPLR